MRPLTVVQLLPALEAGGVERSTLEIASALRTRGHRAVVISAGGRLLPELQALGGEHISLDIGRKSLRTLRLIAPLREQLQRIAPDIVHVRSRLPAWLLHFALRGYAGSPPHRVSTVHGLNSANRYSRIMTRAERVICVSQTVRDYVLHYYPRTDPARLQVIERGIDPSHYPRGFSPSAAWRQQFAEEFPALQGGRLLLLPARGTRLKGHHEAIKLLAALRDVGEDVRLMLVGAQQPGRAAYVAELQALAERFGVARHVVITPQRNDLRELYAVSALVLQLSNKPESFGRTVLEALSMGVPVLGWAHGGVGELLHHLYPVGAVQLGDGNALMRSALQLLDLQPPVPETIPFTLAAMQAATIALYEHLAA
ncbi:MAG: glycosyltransferase [Xanthomonadaceae bacterium]|nr:glycosyltransferase [Xanthomonadaceae bacterium]MDP2187001.1 glycosyltransferase [Xanthomonadales bacterium]MDZ4115581.1 glycosyltransferase [Xanthomonadaceae bacterium]MDZ4379471.1 glycosyltransferase [Xanthomonadaceae bacterium]